MAHRLEIVAVRINDEGGVVVWRVVSQSRRAVVLAARLERGRVESIDARACPGGDREMDARGRFIGCAEPERGLAVAAESRAASKLMSFS